MYKFHIFKKGDSKMGNFLKRLLDTETAQTLFGEERIKGAKKIFTPDDKNWTCAYCDSKNSKEALACDSCGANPKDE